MNAESLSPGAAQIPTGENEAAITDQRAIKAALRAAYQVVMDRSLRDLLRDDGQAPAILGRLRMPQAARPALLQVIDATEAQEKEVEAESHSGGAGGADEASRDMEGILLRSFDHIQWSFVTLLCMSMVVFLMGLAVLGVAVVRAAQGETNTATFAVAGVGLADILLLFYRRPWRDISTNLSNTQRVRVIATSYLAGLSLINRGAAQSMEILEQLTRNSVALLDEATAAVKNEEHGGGPTEVP